MIPASTENRRKCPKTGKLKDRVMHYPHRISKVKRARKIGFRARMATKKGRQMINRKRRAGRKVQVV